MWFWSKKETIEESGILAGSNDHHSHILPGVDDGVETIAEALRILATYERLGIKSLWLTPHIMEDIPNDTEKLQARFTELKAAYNGNIELHLAAEYMIDNHLRGLLNKTNKNSSFSNREYPQVEGVGLLPIGKKRDHLLVETSYFNPPMRLRETLRQIKSLGYHPLLAHPERYMYIDNDEYCELHNEGVKFQLNLMSLAGGYGKAVKKRAQWLLKEGLYDVTGSDLHCEDAIAYITECKLSSKEIENLRCLLEGAI